MKKKLKTLGVIVGITGLAAFVAYCFLYVGDMERFYIPTGSMAPTILGDHIDVVCPTCGYRFAAEAQSVDNGNIRNANCPNCGLPLNINAKTIKIIKGDTILVSKTGILADAEPRRWDVIAFYKPGANEVNYIMRLVGMPGEDVMIEEGNIFTRKAGSGSYGILRKPLDVQESLWRHVWYMDCAPSGGKPAPPWTYESDEMLWKVGFAEILSAKADETFIHFSEPINNDVEYKLRKEYTDLYDVRVKFSVIPENPGGEIVVRILASDEGNTLEARIPVASGDSVIDFNDRKVTTRKGALEVGRENAVAFSHFDQAAYLELNGALVASFEYDSSDSTHRHMIWPVSLGVRRTGAKFRHVKIDRDIYYTEPGEYPEDKSAPGFFVLGDNSISSSDSRMWGRVPKENVFGRVLVD